MMDLPFEETKKPQETITYDAEKREVLDLLFRPALRGEIELTRDAGYEISIGNTPDKAYESPDKIIEVFERLSAGGEHFANGSRQLAMGSASLALALEYMPIPQLNTVRRRIKKQREILRDDILYSQPDVQAQPWHQQNGKALALATITDAHELQTVAGGDGIYETMSGRLRGELCDDFLFPETGVSENLAGKRLRDAVIESKHAFKGSRSAHSADAAAEQDLQKLVQFTEAPVQQGFKDIVAYCTDSLGIRSRKEEVRAEINRHVDESDKESFLMMSVGCGTALPMLEVMQDVHAKGRDAKMILIDQDPIALAAAYQFATQMGLEEKVEIHCSQLFVGEGFSTHLMELDDVLKGRKLDICEDSGLREYFPDSFYENLTRQSWHALADDGLMTTGNMNKNRPQAEFLHGLMGWPLKVRMRHIKDITRLHKKAGIPAEASRLRVTQDGVYTLCFSSKKHSS